MANILGQAPNECPPPPTSPKSNAASVTAFGTRSNAVRSCGANYVGVFWAGWRGGGVAGGAEGCRETANLFVG